MTLGNSGNLQGIHGTLTFVATNAAIPSLPVTIDDSADSTNTTVSILPTGPGNSQVSGLTSSPVQLTGSSLITLTLKGGAGNNKLVAPDTANAWDITAANGGLLDRTTTFTHFGNLQGGIQSDNIFFKPAASLSGNLDGGPGTDTVYYQAGMLTGSDVIDLPNHIAPRSRRPGPEFRIVQCFQPVDPQQPRPTEYSSQYSGESAAHIDWRRRNKNVQRHRIADRRNN